MLFFIIAFFLFFYVYIENDTGWIFKKNHIVFLGYMVYIFNYVYF